MGSIPKRTHQQHIGIVILAVICLSIIGGTYRTLHTPKEQHLVDSLNNKAYQLRYTQQDSVLLLTQLSLQHTTDYNSGKAEALNHQLFQAGLNIDFITCESLYDKIQRITNNQVELLISDITMMMMCQKTGQHLLFFEYRNNALKHIARIEEEDELEGRIAQRFFYAINEYRLISTLHILQTATLQLAEQELDKITISEELRQDKTLWANYHYIKGLLFLNKGHSQPENVINAFDLLFQSFTVAERHQLTYITASIEQVFSEMLTHATTDSLISLRRGNEAHYLYNFFVHHDTIEATGKHHLHVAKAMSQNSIEKANQFGNLILEANGLLALGDAYFYNHEPEEALSYYEQALECLNRHHDTFYSDSLSTQKLVSYNTTTQESVDMLWVKDEKIQTIPATLLHIREALSRAYSAVGFKQQSDYNRNIYLDLLSHTRENKYIESRIKEGEQQNRILLIILYALPLLMLSIIVTSIYYTRKRHSRNKQLSALLDYLDQWFKDVYATDNTDDLEHLKQQCIERAKDRRVVTDVILPFIDWKTTNMEEKGRSETEITQLFEEFRKSELQIEDHKRDNILKRAKVSLIHAVMPFIDRMLYVAHKLHHEETYYKNRLTYISELADQIESNNNVLTEWININKGKIDLTIEQFAVQEIFDMIAKSEYSYGRKGIHLQIQKTNAIIKADKALTFFMLNTLAENARKFTPSGGTVVISATEECDFVELAVTDNGVGLTNEEREMILTSKIYDAQKIGENNENIQKEKGNGFGLLNCKGVIEKYKKEGDIFAVCQFNIESQKGKGSRFSFRLPKGLARMIIMGWVMIGGLMGMSSLQAANIPDNTHMDNAIAYTDSLYNCNIKGEYERAIGFANKALEHLNSHYKINETAQRQPLSLNGNHSEEIQWLKSDMPADYHLILQIRNEAAVAALALCDWDLYEFNNQQYIALNQLLANDSTLLDQYHETTEQHKQIKIYITLIVLLLLLMIAYIYIVYARKDISYRYNIMKVLEMNRSLLQVVTNNPNIGSMLEIMLEGLREIHEVKEIKLMLITGNKVEIHVTPHDRSDLIQDDMLHKAYHEKRQCFDREKHIKVYPLTISRNENQECHGSIGICYTETNEHDEYLDCYIINYLTLLLAASVVRKDTTDMELTKVENERQRALFEENRLHVQNMILENCLSTIKHESMYYPGRIKQIVETLKSDEATDIADNKLKSLVEVVEYYKYIYALFCKQADRQIETGLYKCTDIPTGNILSRWCKSMQRYTKRQVHDVQIESQTDACEMVYAEQTLISFMLEAVSKDWLKRLHQDEKNNTLTLLTEHDGQFIRFRLQASWLVYEETETNDLFHAEKGHYALLLCKEIIREHDKLNNFCGCRINIETNDGKGNTLWFTIPQNR